MLKDGAKAPAALTADTHYSIESADHGTLKILDVDGKDQPWTASYSYAKAENVPMFSDPAREVWIKLDAVNTDAGDANKPYVIELYRVRFDPVGELPLIHENYGALSLTGAILADASKADDTKLNRFGRVVRVG